MKLKILKNEFKEIETDLDLPVYLYFQDDQSNDELVMISEKFQLKIKKTYHSFIIEKSKPSFVLEHYIKNNLTTKEHFMEEYDEALKTISDGIL